MQTLVNTVDIYHYSSILLWYVYQVHYITIDLISYVLSLIVVLVPYNDKYCRVMGINSLSLVHYIHQGSVPQNWKQLISLCNSTLQTGWQIKSCTLHVWCACICSMIYVYCTHCTYKCTNIMSHLIRLTILSDSQIKFWKNYSELIRMTHDIALNLRKYQKLDWCYLTMHV